MIEIIDVNRISILHFVTLDWFDLTNNDEGQGKIHLIIQFTSKEALEEEKDREVKDAYFPLRANSRFVLYQDAETPQMPQVIHYMFIVPQIATITPGYLKLNNPFYIFSSKVLRFLMVVHIKPPDAGMTFFMPFKTLKSLSTLLDGVFLRKYNL